MGYKKLVRFAAIKNFPHVLEYPQGMPGKWADFFHNTYPTTLELACGKGEYTIGLARLYPEGNYIGVDIKGNRIWVGANQAIKEGLKNVAFIRSQIDFLPTYFAKEEVKDIWITFPDPQLRSSRAKKRLTHPRFLRLYREVLAPGGQIHLKTDSPDLYAFTRKVIELFDLPLFEASDDIYKQEKISPELNIRTHYEGLDIARSSRVHYLRFGLSGSLLDDSRLEALKEMLYEGG
ncbi:MAG TPA: tRNA (guanosine(46)-N7)-methyltransferase TrmB [Dinghuibacter sp.]|uniref:tRNA (guanosine(46)-N7)-methyltransferase TrmB n=1 Tax=Dinghuibacter sp. TaxID=2024697 RepID=UPI002CB2E42D|nr:tRNA (guanosine(46)-N7)-methyltransferase TrmB [Dinghuibacter sp.]HTJ15034.1 tRNA (guanosine(46)-N7)-methyltransferase TrmB [Dinghuibacter sp.]